MSRPLLAPVTVKVLPMPAKPGVESALTSTDAPVVPGSDFLTVLSEFSPRERAETEFVPPPMTALAVALVPQQQDRPLPDPAADSDTLATLACAAETAEEPLVPVRIPDQLRFIDPEPSAIMPEAADAKPGTDTDRPTSADVVPTPAMAPVTGPSPLADADQPAPIGSSPITVRLDMPTQGTTVAAPNDATARLGTPIFPGQPVEFAALTDPFPGGMSAKAKDAPEKITGHATASLPPVPTRGTWFWAVADDVPAGPDERAPISTVPGRNPVPPAQSLEPGKVEITGPVSPDLPLAVPALAKAAVANSGVAVDLLPEPVASGRSAEIVLPSPKVMAAVTSHLAPAPLVHPIEVPPVTGLAGPDVIPHLWSGNDSPDPEDVQLLAGLVPAYRTDTLSQGNVSETVLTVPRNTAAIAGQIVDGLTKGADGATTLTLSPDELGQVRVTFQQDRQDPDRIVVMLGFDRPDTQDLFRRNVDQLAEALRNAGFSGVQIDFGSSGDQAGQPAPESQEAVTIDRIEAASTDPFRSGPARPTVNDLGTLDLRL